MEVGEQGQAVEESRPCLVPADVGAVSAGSSGSFPWMVLGVCRAERPSSGLPGSSASVQESEWQNCGDDGRGYDEFCRLLVCESRREDQPQSCTVAIGRGSDSAQGLTLNDQGA